MAECAAGRGTLLHPEDLLNRVAHCVFSLLILATTAFAETIVVEKPIVSPDGKTAGLQVQVNGVVLTVHSQDDSYVQIDGMPIVSIEKDALTSRHNGVLVGGEPAVRFTYDGHGYLRSATVGRAKLELSLPSKGLVTETLRNHSGRAIVQATVKGDTPRLTPNPPFCLDPIKNRLGIDQSSVSLTVEHVDGSSLSILHGASGEVIAYIVTYGGNRFGFDSAGKPLFIDVAVEMAQSSLAVHGSEHNPIAIHDISAVAPNRIIVTVDGQIGACVDGPAAGAIAAFWSTDTSKGSATAFRMKTAAPSSPSAERRQRRQLQLTQNEGSCVLVYEGTTQICYDTLGLDCEAPVDHYGYYCTSTVSSGGTTSGGGTAASNQISGDLVLKTQVSAAIATAQTKLTKCAAALLAKTALNGQTLATMLAAKANPPAGGWTLQAFLSNGSGQTFKMDTDSDPNGFCAAGYPAYTPLYTTSRTSANASTTPKRAP